MNGTNADSFYKILRIPKKAQERLLAPKSIPRSNRPKYLNKGCHYTLKQYRQNCASGQKRIACRSQGRIFPSPFTTVQLARCISELFIPPLSLVQIMIKYVPWMTEWESGALLKTLDFGGAHFKSSCSLLTARHVCQCCEDTFPLNYKHFEWDLIEPPPTKRAVTWCKD